MLQQSIALMIGDLGSFHKKTELLYAVFMPSKYCALIGGAHLGVLESAFKVVMRRHYRLQLKLNAIFKCPMIVTAKNLTQ